MAEMERMNNDRHGRHREENDFTPAPVTTSRPTRQLEFHQAMADFKRMFPNMDSEVIEAVLRANNGIVDATIDQLLTMNVDTDDHWEDENAIADALAAGLSMSTMMGRDSPPPKSPIHEKAMLSDPIGESPPPYSEAVQSPQMLISPGSRKHKSSPPNPPTANLLDLGLDELALSNTEPKTPISSWDSPVASAGGSSGKSNMRVNRQLSEDSWHSRSRSTSDDTSWKGLPPSNLSWNSPPYTDGKDRKLHGRSYSVGSTKKQSYRNWNPPLLGNLPDDFLRLSPSSNLTSRSSPHTTRKSSSGTSHKPPRRSASAVSSMEKPKHHRSMSQPTRHVQTMSARHHLFSSDMLQERIKENEHWRQISGDNHDPKHAQYLEDERLALALQNSEFLQELRDNEDFMNILERERMNAVAFEPVAMSPVSPTREDMMEGYGDDRDKSLGAFPFSQQLPKPDDEDAELRRKLKHMGKASRKQFSALARKFFSRKKKKSSKQIIREKLAPSRMNLLEEDTSDQDENTHRSSDGRPQFENLPSQVPGIRTVQRPPYHPNTVISYNPHNSHAV